MGFSPKTAFLAVLAENGQNREFAIFRVFGLGATWPNLAANGRPRAAKAGPGRAKWRHVAEHEKLMAESPARSQPKSSSRRRLFEFLKKFFETERT